MMQSPQRMSVLLCAIAAIAAAFPPSVLAQTLSIAESQVIAPPDEFTPDADEAGFFGWAPATESVNLVIGANSPPLGGSYASFGNPEASVQLSLTTPGIGNVNPNNASLAIEGTWKFEKPGDPEDPFGETENRLSLDGFRVSFTAPTDTKREDSRSYSLSGIIGDPLSESFKDCVFTSPGDPCAFRVKVPRPRIDKPRGRIDMIMDYFDGDSENQLSDVEGDIVLSITRFELVPFVRGVNFFYNNSALDGNGEVVDATDFAAVATDKAPLRFGETASFANVSGYSRGINGLFIDFDDLPDDGAGIDAGDLRFAVGNDNFPENWGEAAAPASVGVLPGEGVDGSDRVYVTFADGSIRNTWLRMTIQANADTGLVDPEDYFFGIAPGETGAGFLPGIVGVDAADLQSIARNLTPLALSGTELITEPNDLNRDRTVNAFDLQVVAVNLSTSVINLITPQLVVPVTAAGVPEPGACTLAALAIGLAVAAACFRRRHGWE